MLVKKYNYDYSNIKIGDKFLFKNSYGLHKELSNQIVTVTYLDDDDVIVTNHNNNQNAYIVRCRMNRHLIPILKIDDLSINERVSVFCKIMGRSL